MVRPAHQARVLHRVRLVRVLLILDRQEHLEPHLHLLLLAPVVLLDRLVVMDQVERVVLRAVQEHRDRLVQRGHQGHQALPVLMEVVERVVQREVMEQVARLVAQEATAHLVLLDRLEVQGPVVLLDLLAPVAHRDQEDRMEHQAQVVLLAVMVHLVHLERVVELAVMQIFFKFRYSLRRIYGYIYSGISNRSRK